MVSDQPDNHSAELEIPEEISGLRMTRQRQEIYRVLMEQRDHPTAQEVFTRAKERLPHISLATVYNCLDALVQHNIIRQVHFERESSRYCPNIHKHAHFHDVETGRILDVDYQPDLDLSKVLNLPKGITIDDIEITLRGKLPK